AGFWWAASPKDYWPDDEEQLQTIKARWQEPYGDRQQEIVIIGMQMNPAAITAGFDACLLNDAEIALGTEAWQTLPDPFPQWKAIHEDTEEVI
ncbi:MAG: GTP-binding protein, partial [Methylotenera sp.]|nr:GTP-binding protein [Methylotenera sp.]